MTVEPYRIRAFARRQKMTKSAELHRALAGVGCTVASQSVWAWWWGHSKPDAANARFLRIVLKLTDGETLELMGVVK